VQRTTMFGFEQWFGLLKFKQRLKAWQTTKDRASIDWHARVRSGPDPGGSVLCQ
jgi:hypothetical protein